MAKTSMTTLTLAINDQQAKRVLESLKAQMESVKKTLEETQEKFRGERAWDAGDTAEKINKQIKELKKELKSLNSAYSQGMTQMKGIDEKLKDVSKASYNQLTKDRTALTNTLKGLSKDSAENLKNYEDTAKRLQEVRDEIAKRDVDIRSSMTEGKSKEILSNPLGYSVDQVEKAISAMRQLNKQQVENSGEWRESNKLISEGSAYLEKFTERVKKLQMEDLQLKLYETDPSISDQDLNTLVKYWESMAAGADKGTRELQYYNDMLEEGRALLQQRTKDKAGAVMSDPSAYSVDEINEAIQATQKLQAAQQPGSDAWKRYGEEIRNAKKTLDKFNADAKESAMKLQLNRPSSLSTDALSEQKKYWQETINASDTLNPKLVEYKNNLQMVADEERTRAKISAEGIFGKVNSGTWEGTIGQTKEAYEELKKYRSLYEKGIEDDQIKQIDRALDSLKQKAKESEQGYISMQEAINKGLNAQSFNGTLEELETLKRRLQEIKQTEINLGATDASDKMKDINKAIENVDVSIAKAKGNIKDFDKFIQNIDGKSLKELQRAASQLEEELKNSAQNADDFAKKSSQLRRIGKEIDELKKKWEDHDNILVKTGKRLASYVLVYTGFNEIKGKIQEIINLNLKLSDSMADVQKTTGLAGLELQELGREIEEIDSRTSTDKLYEIAAAAGQIGLKTQEDVLGFTKAANVITVALNELGTEGATELMKIAQLTGELADNTTEEALLRIGSSINELTANSAATAGPITDFINRFGGIAAGANIATYEMAALGAATDASAQSAEVAGTSMNKFVNALLSNTKAISYAANINYKELQGLIASGKTMDAVIMVLERMQSMSSSAQQGLLKELGSEGARMNQYVSTLVANLDMLKRQLDISRKAYEENTSVQNEYNVKNESAIGILERMKNSFIDTFVNSGITEALKEILLYISELPDKIERNIIALTAMRTVLVAIGSAALIKSIQGLIGVFVSLGTALDAASIKFGVMWANAARETAQAMVRAGKSAVEARGAVTGLTGAFRVLWTVMKANPVGAIITALTVVGTAAWMLIDRTDKLAKATEELEKRHVRERNELEAMRKVLMGATSSYEDQTRVLRELNSVYEKYLGYEIDMLDSYERKAAALDYINAKLKEQQALEVYNKKVETVNDEFTDRSRNSLKNLEKGFSGIAEITQYRWQEVLEIINEAAERGELVLNENPTTNAEKFRKFISEKIFSVFDVPENTVSGRVMAILSANLQEYAVAYGRHLDTMKQLDSEYGQTAEMNAERTRNALIENVKQQEAAIAAMPGILEERKKAIIEAGQKEGEAEAVINDKIKAAEEKHQQDLLKMYQNYQKDISKLQKEEVEKNDAAINDVVTQTSIEEVREKYDAETAAAVQAFREKRSQVESIMKQLADDEKIADEKQRMSDKQRADLQNKLTEHRVEQLLLQKKAELEASEFMVTTWTQKSEQVKGIMEKMKEDMAGDAYGTKSWNLHDWKTFGEETIKNLGSANIDSLTAAYKALENDTKVITQDIDSFNKMFDTTFESQKQMDAQVKKWAAMVKKELESRGRGVTGSFIWREGKDGKDNGKKKAKEEYKAALAALEAFYKERETIILENGRKEGKLQTTIDREISRTKQQYEEDAVELRKLLIGDKSKFDPTKFDGYTGEVTGTEFFGKNKDLKFLQELAVQIGKYGIAMEDGIRNQISKGLLTVEEAIMKEKQKIEKILLEDDFSEQVRQQYLESIDNLGLLFNVKVEEFKDIDKQLGEARLAYLQEWSKESYNLTAKDLQDKMEQEEIFSAWRQGRTAEDYEALLIQLRKFNDDMIEADKKTAERRKKIADAKFDMSGQKTEGEERIQKAEAKLDFGKQMESFGVGGEQVVNDLEIEVLKEKIVYEQQWLALLAQESQLKQKQLQNEIEAKERLLANESVMSEREKLNNELIFLRQRLASEQNQYTLASTEAINNMLDYQKQATGIYTQQLTWYFDHLKDYQGQIDTFAQSMGEGIFGSKEDRQQAAKDLLSSVLTTSKNLLQVWLTQLATRRLIDDMEVKQTEATEMRKRAIKLQSMIQDGTIAITGLTVDAAKAEASTLLSSAEATGKEVAKKGLIGLAIGAAISAALSALLGAALGKVNQAKAEIASTTGAGSGRLATGMLTYADGNYPVLGNDGNVYNAKYEGANMKTGIYRGGAHFGIFSEKKPEAIIDGDTTQRLIMNHPDIWKAIVTLSKTGRLEHGMRTFASGNIDQLAKQVEGLEASPATTGNADMIQMQATMAATQQALAQLTQVLAGGIKANINMYGEDGMYKNMKKAEKFASVRKYK